MLRKKGWLFGVLVIMLVVITSACSKSNVPPKGSQEGSSQSKTGTVELRLATSVQGGAADLYGNAIAATVNKHSTKIHITAFPTAGTLENQHLLRSGEAQLALGTGDQVYDSYTGTGSFKDKPNKDLRHIFTIGYTFINFVVRADSDISSLADLKGKRVGTGEPGSMTSQNMPRILSAYNINMDDIKAFPLSFSEQIQSLKDGKLDVIVYNRSWPDPPLVDLNKTIQIRFLSIDDEHWQKLSQAAPKDYFARVVLKANTYQGQTKDLPQAGVTLQWVCTKEIPDDVVYEVVKTFFENKASDADAVHRLVRETTPQLAVVPAPAPLHPGAERYFKEKGWLN
ncbi:MAG: TAXI family TRAP transporter solute-binding subunit [Bacillota bacterium]